MNFLDYIQEFFHANWKNNIVDVALITILIYALFLLIRGSRAVQAIRGIGILAIIIYTISSFLEIELNGLSWLLEKTLSAFVLAIPVIFQPELRRFLENLGIQTNRFWPFRRNTDNLDLIKNLEEACKILSQRRHGALILVEQNIGLQEYIDTGIYLDAVVSSEILLTIFNKTTDLHDGAIIIRENRIASAGCVMPLSTQQLSNQKIGLRHRAAIGSSEASDAVVIVVSEETGKISVASAGKIIPRPDLNYLNFQSFLNIPTTLGINTKQS